MLYSNIEWGHTSKFKKILSDNNNNMITKTHPLLVQLFKTIHKSGEILQF